MEKRGRHKHTGKHTKGILFLLVLAVFCSLFIAVGLGAVSLGPGTTLRVIAAQIPALREQFSPDCTALEYNMIWKMRLPRVLLGFIVGASLGTCGVAMQALVRNKLADPFIFGVSSGASAFASLFMVFGVFSFLGRYALPLSAFLGALVSIVFVYTASRVRGRIHITQLLLTGVAVAMMMDAVTSLIIVAAPDAFAGHNIDFWLSGSLAGAKWAYLSLPLAVMLLCLAYLLANYRALNALVLGEETAGTLGIHVSAKQKSLVLIASLLAGVTISVSGSIGFVGMMAPHISRILVGADHRKVLPLSALLGGLAVVWADVAARMIAAPEEIPVGLMTAFVGAPFFLVMLKSKNSTRTIA